MTAGWRRREPGRHARSVFHACNIGQEQQTVGLQSPGDGPRRRIAINVEGFVIGHAGGDQVIQGAARLLQQDLPASIAALPPVSEQATPLTVSIGINTWSGNPDISLDQWVSDADKALYQAKYSGRNRVVSNMSRRSS